MKFSGYFFFFLQASMATIFVKAFYKTFLIDWKRKKREQWITSFMHVGGFVKCTLDECLELPGLQIFMSYFPSLQVSSQEKGTAISMYWINTFTLCLPLWTRTTQK